MCGWQSCTKVPQNKRSAWAHISHSPVTIMRHTAACRVSKSGHYTHLGSRVALVVLLERPTYAVQARHDTATLAVVHGSAQGIHLVRVCDLTKNVDAIVIIPHSLAHRLGPHVREKARQAQGARYAGGLGFGGERGCMECCNHLVDVLPTAESTAGGAR